MGLEGHLPGSFGEVHHNQLPVSCVVSAISIVDWQQNPGFYFQLLIVSPLHLLAGKPNGVCKVLIAFFVCLLNSLEPYRCFPWRYHVQVVGEHLFARVCKFQIVPVVISLSRDKKTTDRLVVNPLVLRINHSSAITPRVAPDDNLNF